ncbi:DUF4166 domain-containing protein [Microbacterium oleivorans]|uniref:DUF4166 domain-containing protein n=1 Tax=Microbacterium oleivorans TaxID=273677 RepID=UPI0020412C38|nr:DUF4166 domain-containing protein [Microbacterium oleivorans]MCM3696792.1 DUF4166 domain-containing protein [Microbacterium oleivorans]
MTSGERDAALSVYERVLGAEVETLPPVLRRYFGAIPDGHVGVGEGVYSVVGSRYRRVAGALLRWSARHDVLFPEGGRDVPFVVENRIGPDGSLEGTRWFGFPRVTRVMRDTMRADRGAIVERLGRRGGLEVRLSASATPRGMVLRSRRLAWWVRGIRVPLPPLAGVEVRESDAGGGRQGVDVRLRMPLVGEVFRYSGTFAYRIVRESDSGPAVSPGLPTLSMWLTQNSPN